MHSHRYIANQAGSLQSVQRRVREGKEVGNPPLPPSAAGKTFPGVAALPLPSLPALGLGRGGGHAARLVPSGGQQQQHAGCIFPPPVASKGGRVHQSFVLEAATPSGASGVSSGASTLSAEEASTGEEEPEPGGLGLAGGSVPEIDQGMVMEILQQFEEG